MMSSQDEDSEEGGSGAGLPSMGDLLRLLRKRKLIIGFAMLLCGAASVGMLQLITPQFQAQATVFIDPRDHNVANMKQVTSDLVANTPSIESETEIMHSTSVAGRVIDDLQLGDDLELVKPSGMTSQLKKMIASMMGRPEPAHATSMSELIETTAAVKPNSDQVVDAFLSRVTAERVRETFLIQVGFRSKDPDKAARVANAMADAYVKLQVETKMNAAQQLTVWLDRQIGELREKVFVTEKAVAEFRASNNLFDIDGHPLDEHAVARQMEQLTLSRNATAATKAKYLEARQVLDNKADISAIGEVLKANTITALRQQYTDYLRQQAAAASRYGALHPNLIKANAQVESARQELRNEVVRIVSNLKSEADQAAAAQASLEANLVKIQDILANHNTTSVRLHELEREATAAREVYENFLKRVQETQQQTDLQAPDARIVNRAIVPTVPVSPKKTLILMGGFGGGLGIGLVLALIVEFLFPSFVRTSEIEKSFKLRHITTIARFDRNAAPEGVTLSELRAILLAPHSALAQAIRTIRVAIGRQRKGREPQTVLVTSALAEEGKSVIASNLALHFSLSGVRTLLIDCDLSGRGLSPLLLPGGGMSLYECIMSRQPLRYAIVKEAATGLHFLPGVSKEQGSITPAEVLSSPLMAAALKKLAQEFEVIVLDGPGLLQSVDSRILGELSDQIVFVHKWGDTSQAAARQALRALGHSLGKVTGVVLNQVQADQLASEEALSSDDSDVKQKGRREPKLAA